MHSFDSHTLLQSFDVIFHHELKSTSINLVEISLDFFFQIVNSSRFGFVDFVFDPSPTGTKVRTSMTKNLIHGQSNHEERFDPRKLSYFDSNIRCTVLLKASKKKIKDEKLLQHLEIIGTINIVIKEEGTNTTTTFPYTSQNDDFRTVQWLFFIPRRLSVRPVRSYDHRALFSFLP